MKRLHLARIRVRSARGAPTEAPTGISAARVAAGSALAVLLIGATALLLPGAAGADQLDPSEMADLYVICPDPIAEGDSAQMGVGHPDFEIRAVTVFTYIGSHTAGYDDFSGYDGVRVEQSSGEILWIPIDTTADARPEHDETFAIGFWAAGVWNGCVATIADDDAPRITGVDFNSSPADGWAHRAGEAVDVAVSLDQKVEVVGSPVLALFLGQDGAAEWRGASYHRGSGTSELVFRYLVQRTDVDLDGVSVGAAATGDDGAPAYGFSGTINALGTDVPIDYTHPGLKPGWTQRVDGRPYVQADRTISVPAAGGQAYRANEIIEFSFTFDTSVAVEGDVCVTLYLGDGVPGSESAVRQAGYRRGSGTDTLVFSYTVRPGDNSPEGITLTRGTSESGFCGNGTITGEETGVEISPWYSERGIQRGHRIDTVAPAVSAVSIVSRPADGEAYATGEAIRVEVALSEDVTVSGAPYLELEIGQATGRATLAAEQGTGNSLVFEYEVQSGDADADGVSIGPNSLRLNGGDIHDDAGNAAGLSHLAVAADATHRVDTSAGG